MKLEGDTLMVVENQQSLKFEIWLVRKLTVFKLLRIAKPENWIFFLPKKFNTQDVSHKPSILFF